MKFFALAAVLTLGIFGNVFAQEKKAITGGIVNGKAKYLPKPDYPQEAKDFCAGGRVEVEVFIGEDGNVIEARAISGDKLLHVSAVEAAKKAKFLTGHLAVKAKGVIVYNFDSFAKCVVTGIVNKKAISIPKPKVANLNRPGHLQIKKEEIVAIQTVIDMSGNVISAKATLGHPLLRRFIAAFASDNQHKSLAPVLTKKFFNSSNAAVSIFFKKYFF